MNASPYTVRDFQAEDHAAWGFRKAEEALAQEEAVWAAVRENDPLGYARELVLAYEKRLADARARMREQLDELKRTGDWVMHYQFGIEFERAAARIARDHLAEARTHLASLECAA